LPGTCLIEGSLDQKSGVAILDLRECERLFEI